MRLIDAELIIDYLIDEGQYNGEKYGIKWGEQIKFSPSEVDEIVTRTVPTVDAVPVVRCKDCKYYDNGVCYLLKGIYDAVSDMDFCSRGVRREVEQCERSFMDEWEKEVDDQLSRLTARKDGDTVERLDGKQ